MKYESQWYSFDKPKKWKVENEDGVLLLFNEFDGYGALNISSYEITTDYVFHMDVELRDFVASVVEGSIDFISDEAIMRTKDTVATELSIKNTYWKFWLIYEKCKALFISYNCDIEDREIEQQEISSIIKSIQIK